MSRFESFVAIDWSGAKGKRHKGIAIAEARGTAPPRLVRPGHVWSREEVLRWLLKRSAKEPTLFGFDFSFAPPIVERGEYLIGEPDVPKTAREFWAYVDAKSDDEDLAGLMTMIQKGQIKPVVDKVLPLKQAAEGLRLIQDRKVIGKVVVTP